MHTKTDNINQLIQWSKDKYSAMTTDYKFVHKKCCSCYDQKISTCMETFHGMVHSWFDENHVLSCHRMDYASYAEEYNQHIPCASQDHPESYGDWEVYPAHQSETSQTAGSHKGDLFGWRAVRSF